MKMNALLFVFVSFCLFSYVVGAGVIYGTDIILDSGFVHIQGDGQTEFSIIGWGDNYVQFDNIGITMNFLTRDITFVVSYLNEQADNMSKGERILEFNVSYTGGAVAFTFTGNNSNDNMLYNLDVDGVRVRTEAGPYTFQYTQGSWSTHRFLLACGSYQPDPPYNGSSHYDIPSNTVNLTWERGNFSNQEVVVGSTSYPASPSDGTVWYNGTQLFYNFSVNESQAFSVFSFNSSTSAFSEPLFIPWGVLAMNCYNESNVSQNLTFDVIITDQALSETYDEQGCINTKYIDLFDIPYGINTIFQVSSSGYETRTYAYDLVVNQFYEKNFYLPKSLPTGGTSDPDYDPVNETYATLYLLSVTNQYSQPVGDAKIEIQRYINDAWADVGVYLTSSAGTIEVFLYAGETYAITISKDGYQDEIEPSIVFSEEVLVHNFQLNYIEPTPDTIITGYDIFTFEAYYLSGDNTTMYVEFVDLMGNNDDAQVLIYQNGSLLLYVYNITFADGENFTWLLGDHSVHNYTVVLKVFNHTDLNTSVFTWNIIIPVFTTSDEGQFDKADEIEANFVAILGQNIFGWLSLAILFLGVYVISSVGRAWVGIGIVGLGAVIFLFQAVFGLPNFTLIQLTVIPFFILYGFLVQIAKSKREVKL